MTLLGKQKRGLRALGHKLKVVLQVGANGVTPQVIGALNVALRDHELVKAKLASEDRDERDAMAQELATACEAEIAQQLGRTVLFFKKREEKSRLRLTKSGVERVTPAAPAPRQLVRKKPKKTRPSKTR